MPALRKFEGREVIAVKAAISNAGDGLSEALAIEPEELRIGQKVRVVLEGVVDRLAFAEAKDSNQLIRTARIKASTVTLVEEELVKDVLEDQRIRNEEARGVVRLAVVEDDDAGEG
jgi:hypothetical protein